MEWFTCMNSTSKHPSFIWLPGGVTLSFAEPVRLCSFSLLSISPIVRAVPYTGTFSFFKRYGTAPIWSSWPWVITTPLILSRFFSTKVKSGITRSTPSISSSGKARPQSTIIMSPWHS